MKDTLRALANGAQKGTLMINCDDFVAAVIRQMKSAQPGQGLEVLTFKGDRSITITKTAPDTYLVTEKGFTAAQYPDLSLEKLKKVLKTLEKREFPRSNKLRTRKIDSGETLDTLE